jgi:hypothetical protein
MFFITPNHRASSICYLQQISLVSDRGSGEKTFSPSSSKRALLPLSSKRTQFRLKSLLQLVWLAPDVRRTHGRPQGQEYRLRLKRSDVFLYKNVFMHSMNTADLAAAIAYLALA